MKKLLIALLLLLSISSIFSQTKVGGFIEERGSLGLANTFEPNLSSGTIKTSAIYILAWIAFDI